MKKGELLNKMLVLMVTAHANQFDKGGAPYALHCLQVMHNLNTTDEELMCVALGHDIIEDTKTTYKDLRDLGFTERVIDGIRHMTKLPGQTHDEYREQVKSNKDSILVKMADLKHNSDITRLKGVSEKDIARMTKYHHFYLELKNELHG